MAANTYEALGANTETETDRLIDGRNGLESPGHPSSPPPAPTPPAQPIGCPPTARSAMKRIGISNLAIIGFGFLGFLTATVYISFLWEYSPGVGYHGPDSPLWRKIALSGWLATSVTLATVLLRTVTALQTTVAISLLAALALEDAKAPLNYAPLLLTLRGTGSASGMALLQYAFHSFASNPAGNAVLLVLMSTTLASQFSSALLVSDLGPFSIRNYTQSAAIPYALQSNELVVKMMGDVATQHWTGGGSEYPVFAEYSEPPANRQDWMFDTGPTLRAFPPFGSARDRSSLHGYRGNTTVLDARFSCRTPLVGVMNLTVLTSTSSHLLQEMVDTYIELHGNFSAVRTPKNNTIPRSFNCTAAVSQHSDDLQAATEWTITICDLGSFPTRDYLVMNTTGTDTEWYEVFKLGQHFTWEVSNVPDTPWLRFSHSRADLSVAVSHCASTFNTSTIPALIAGGPVGSEPSLRWDATRRRYDASSITRLYAGGIDRLSPSARGALSLIRTSWNTTSWAADSAADSVNPTNFISGLSKVYSLGAMNTYDGSISAYLCTSCDGSLGGGFRVQRALVAVFQDVLRETGGSLPLAMGTLWTILAQRGWYDFLPQFDVVEGEEARFTFVGEALMPVRRAGLKAVVVVVVVHNLVVVEVVAWFLWLGRSGRRKGVGSLVGNLWQGYGQVVAGDLGGFVKRTSTATDAEVTKEIEERLGGSGREYVGLRDDGLGVTKLVRRRRV